METVCFSECDDDKLSKLAEKYTAAMTDRLSSYNKESMDTIINKRIELITSPITAWNFILVLHNFGHNKSGIDINRSIDKTLLLTPESIRNLKRVPLMDVSAN